MGIKKLNARQNLKQYNDLLRYAFQVTEKQLLEYGWISASPNFLFWKKPACWDGSTGSVWPLSLRSIR